MQVKQVGHKFQSKAVRLEYWANAAYLARYKAAEVVPHQSPTYLRLHFGL